MVDTVNIAAAVGLPDIVLGPVAVALAPLTSDDLGVLALLGASQWGIYQDGTPVIVADTVLDLSYMKSYAVSDYPVEGGSFASYNKVETPFEGRIRFTSGGSPDVRAALIASVEGVVADLNLYDIVTPDQVYINANVVREEYRRTNTDGGASLLTIDVSVQEIRILSGDTTGASTADPASADQQNGGTVQGGVGSDAVAGGTAGAYPVTTPPPATLGGGVGGLPVTQTGGGIGSA